MALEKHVKISSIRGVLKILPSVCVSPIGNSALLIFVNYNSERAQKILDNCDEKGHSIFEYGNGNCEKVEIKNIFCEHQIYDDEGNIIDSKDHRLPIEVYLKYGKPDELILERKIEDVYSLKPPCNETSN